MPHGQATGPMPTLPVEREDVTSDLGMDLDKRKAGHA